MDNGIGLAPTSTGRPRSVRYALSLGATCVFNAPGQPWRNGRLERFHWTMEKEYWRDEMPATMAEGLAGLVDFINFYNRDRPHGRFSGKAPGDVTPCQVLPPAYWEESVDTDRAGWQTGIVEAVRMVLSDGRLDTWGQQMRLSPLLAGQYVRLRFVVGDGADTGVAIWQPKRNVDVPVAQFHHTMDNRSFRGDSWRLYNDVRHLEFDDDPPANEGLDMQQLENQLGRTLKRKVDLSDGFRPVKEPTDELRPASP